MARLGVFYALSDEQVDTYSTLVMDQEPAE